MNRLYVGLMLAVILALAISVKADRICEIHCTPIPHPVCGYDGKCYTRYNNACEFLYAQCENNAIIQVLIELCDEAETGENPEIVRCQE